MNSKLYNKLLTIKTKDNKTYFPYNLNNELVITKNEIDLIYINNFELQNEVINKVGGSDKKCKITIYDINLN